MERGSPVIDTHDVMRGEGQPVRTDSEVLSQWPAHARLFAGAEPVCYNVCDFVASIGTFASVERPDMTLQDRPGRPEIQ